MQATCQCGKTLYFSDPDEVQVCDRCGLSLNATGKPVREPGRSRTGVVTRPDGEHAGPQEVAPGRGREAARIKAEAARRMERRSGPLVIASELGRIGKKRRRLIILVVVAGAVLGADYVVNPPRKQSCGHSAKDSYLFDLVKVPHECEAMEVLSFLNRAREAILKEREESRTVRPVIEAVVALPGVGDPPEGASFVLSVRGDLSLAADPTAEASGLVHYLVELDGTVRAERGSAATPESTVSGSFE